MEPLGHILRSKRKGTWSWAELRSLARALGFQKDLFLRNTRDKKRLGSGLSGKNVRVMIDTKQLNADLDRTFNMHDAAYNIKVLIVAMDMLSSRVLNFTELHLARVAFQFYEHFDQAGMQLDEFVLLRALKLCGRVIAPSKLMSHVRRIDRLVADRLMLYEFLEILPFTVKATVNEEKEDIQKEVKIVISEEDKTLYKLCDFETLLQTQDQRTWNSLEKTYQDSFSKTPVKRFNDTVEDEKPAKAWYIPPLVDRRKWQKQIRWGKAQGSVLEGHVQQTNTEVKERCWSAMCHCEQSRTFISLQDENKSGIEEQFGERRSKSALSDGEAGKVFRAFRRDPLVTPEDIRKSQLQVEDIKFGIETQDERFKRSFATKNAGYIKRFQKSQQKREFEREVEITQMAKLAAGKMSNEKRVKGISSDRDIHQVVMDRLGESSGLFKDLDSSFNQELSATFFKKEREQGNEASPAHVLGRFEEGELSTKTPKSNTREKLPVIIKAVDKIYLDVERSYKGMTDS